MNNPGMKILAALAALTLTLSAQEPVVTWYQVTRAMCQISPAPARCQQGVHVNIRSSDPAVTGFRVELVFTGGSVYQLRRNQTSAVLYADRVPFLHGASVTFFLDDIEVHRVTVQALGPVGEPVSKVGQEQ